MIALLYINWSWYQEGCIFSFSLYRIGQSMKLVFDINNAVTHDNYKDKVLRLSLEYTKKMSGLCKNVIFALNFWMKILKYWEVEKSEGVMKKWGGFVCNFIGDWKRDK